MRRSAQNRLAGLDELERSAQVAAWLQRHGDLGDIDQLDRPAIEQLLQELRNPPYPLRPKEQAALTPLMGRLTARLDQLSMDELIARIECLSESQQRALLARLSALLQGRIVTAEDM